MKKPLLLAAISLAAILLLAGCGGGGSTAAVAGASAQQAAETEAAEVATATETNETAEESDLGGSLEADGTSGDKLPQRSSEPAAVPQRSSEPAAVSGSPTVYFTSDISAEGLVRIYEALGWTPSGKTAVKISTGEPPASNYLRPELIGDLVQKLDGTIVECNTAYGGSRASSAMHRQVAEDHGFTAIADFDLMDEEGEVEWPVTGGSRLDKIIVGSHAENYTDWVILSHFKGHAMAGFGGAIKNVGIGISSPSGKVYVHSAGTRTSGSIMHSDQDEWLEALAEMVSGFRDHVGEEHIIYINVMNRLSVDPVALDQACVDLVYQAQDSEALVNRIESRNGIHTLEHAEEIGLGSRTYELVKIDE